MLRFILALTVITAIFRVSQDNPYVGFGILLTFALMFAIYTIDMVEHEDIIFERNLLKTPDGRKIYYDIIHSQ